MLRKRWLERRLPRRGKTHRSSLSPRFLSRRSGSSFIHRPGGNFSLSAWSSPISSRDTWYTNFALARRSLGSLYPRTIGALLMMLLAMMIASSSGGGSHRAAIRNVWTADA